jgi:predicted PurR-regulated permease PerM
MPSERLPQNMITGGVAFALSIAALYFGRDLLMPVAMAILLSFLLSPAISRLERAHLPRSLAIALVTAAMAAAAALIGTFVALELRELFASLPDFRAHLGEKLQALRGPLRHLTDAAGWVEQLTRDVDPQATRSRTPKVEIVNRPDWLGMLSSVLSPVLGPLGFAALVSVLTLFILYEREDLRARLIRLLRAAEHPFTARALDEAGARVSSYISRQALLCAAHGGAVALGLALIGLPGAGLFGLLSAGLRVIPYLGPTVAAALPIALSVAGFSGWSMALYTIAFFGALELLSNNLLEPWLYGRGTGLTPFGVVFSAVVWAWLWGGVGLFLAIPLTVCCVVLGRYVEPLGFMTTLFGDEPVGPPDVRLYERLTWREASDAAGILAEASDDPARLSDQLVLPVLSRISTDLERGRYSQAHGAELVALLASLLDEIAPRLAGPQPLRSTRRVELCGASADPAEQLARTWVARTLRQLGFAAEAVARASYWSPEKASAPAEALEPIAVVAALGRTSLARARGRAQQLSRSGAGDRVVLAAWTASSNGTQPDSGLPTVRSCSELVEYLEARASEV